MRVGGYVITKAHVLRKKTRFMLRGMVEIITALSSPFRRFRRSKARCRVRARGRCEGRRGSGPKIRGPIGSGGVFPKRRRAWEANVEGGLSGERAPRLRVPALLGDGRDRFGERIFGGLTQRPGARRDERCYHEGSLRTREEEGGGGAFRTVSEKGLALRCGHAYHPLQSGSARRRNRSKTGGENEQWATVNCDSVSGLTLTLTCFRRVRSAATSPPQGTLGSSDSSSPTSAGDRCSCSCLRR